MDEVNELRPPPGPWQNHLVPWTPRPLPTALNSDGRPVWEPPIFDYSNVIDEEDEKDRRNAILDYTKGDVVRVTSIIDAWTEVVPIFEYWWWAELMCADARDEESRAFYGGLARELAVEKEEIWARFEKLNLAWCETLDDKWYVTDRDELQRMGVEGSSCSSQLGHSDELNDDEEEEDRDSAMQGSASSKDLGEKSSEPGLHASTPSLSAAWLLWRSIHGHEASHSILRSSTYRSILSHKHVSSQGTALALRILSWHNDGSQDGDGVKESSTEDELD